MDTDIGPVGILAGDEVRRILGAAAAPWADGGPRWTWGVTPRALELCADVAGAVPSARNGQRELLLGAGAALLNLRLALRAVGVHPDVQTFPDPGRPELLAVVRPVTRRQPTPVDRELTAAIPRCRTDMRSFAATPVPVTWAARVRRAAEAERAWAAILDPGQVVVLRGLVHRATPTRSAELAVGSDGWAAGELSEVYPSVTPVGTVVQAGSFVVVVGSFRDGPPARLQAGQATQRVVLTAAAAGLSACFVPHVVDVSSTRRELRAVLGGGLWPQVVLRLGYERPGPGAPAIDEGTAGDGAPT